MGAGDGQVVIELVGKDNATQAFIKSLQDMQGSIKNLSDAGSTASGILQGAGENIRRALEFAGVTVGIYEIASALKGFGASVLEIGSKVEMLKGSMEALGGVYGISSQGLQGVVEQLRDFNIPTEDATRAVNAFIKTGLGIDKLVPLAQSAKDVAVTEAKTTKDVFDVMIQAVQTGMPRGLRQIGIGVGDMASLAKKSIQDLENEAGLSLPEKAQVIYGIMQDYAQKFKGISEKSVNSYIEQQNKLVVAAEEAKTALFGFLAPAAMAVTGEKIKAWDDLALAVANNRDRLAEMGQGLAVFVGKAAEAVRNVLEFSAAHKELIKDLLEVYTLYKLSPYIIGFGSAILSAAGALQTFSAAAVLSTTYTRTFIVTVEGVATASIAATSAAGVAFVALAGNIMVAVGALAAFGAYKTFKEPGQLTGPTASGDPFADIAAGPRDKDLVPKRGPLTDPNEPFAAQQRFNAQQIQAQFDAAAKKRQDELKSTLQTPKDKGGGGAGLEAAQHSLENFIQTMQTEMAKASGEGMASLGAWYAKSSKTLDDLAAKGVDITKGKEVLDSAYYAKANKLTEDYNLFVAKESGDAYAEIEAQGKAWLTKYQGLAGSEEQIAAIKGRKITEQSIKDDQERLARTKEYLSGMASAAPFLSQQLDLGQQILAVEEEQGKKKLELDYWSGKLGKVGTEEALTQWRLLEALRSQTVEYQKQAELRKGWQAQGFAGGVQMGVYDLRKEGETWGADQTASYIKSMPRDVSTSMAQMFIDTLKGKKTDFMTMGANMAQGLLQKMLEGALVKGIPSLFGTGDGGGGGGPFGLGGMSKYFSTSMSMSKELEQGWVASQQAMTAASVAGDTARVASLGEKGAEGIGILQMLAKSSILVKAGEAAASTYATVAAIPYIGWLLAPLAAAAAFAAVAAFGNFASFGGGGGESYPIAAGGTSAQGNVFIGGVRQAYARGGIVNRPTYFPMATGMGLMGEAGPEAILPLTRLSGGDLGVKTAGGDGGGGGDHYHITIQAMDSHDVKRLFMSEGGAIVKSLHEQRKNGAKF